MSLLEVTGLNSYYRESHILFDVSLRVEALDRYSGARAVARFEPGRCHSLRFIKSTPAE